MIPERSGLIVWVQHFKSLRRLERLGIVHYVSKKMKYVVLYVNKDEAETVTTQIQRWNFVTKVERSYRNELKTEYSSNIPDKTTFYTY